MADRLRDFTRMNPPIFTVSKILEDPQEFMDEVHKILVSTGATDTEKAELASYGSKMLHRLSARCGRILSFERSSSHLRFFLKEMREAKFGEFINLKHESMTVRDYSLKFVKLSRYDTSLVSNCRDEMSRFLTRITGYLDEECRVAMLHNNMDLSRLMVHVQHVEESPKKRDVCDARRPKPHN